MKRANVKAGHLVVVVVVVMVVADEVMDMGTQAGNATTRLVDRDTRINPASLV